MMKGLVTLMEERGKGGGVGEENTEGRKGGRGSVGEGRQGGKEERKREREEKRKVSENTKGYLHSIY